MSDENDWLFGHTPSQNRAAWAHIRDADTLDMAKYRYYDDEPLRYTGTNVSCRTQRSPADFGLHTMGLAAVGLGEPRQGRLPIRDGFSPYDLLMFEREEAIHIAEQEALVSAKQRGRRELKDQHDALAALTEVVYGPQYLGAFERWWFNQLDNDTQDVVK